MAKAETALPSVHAFVRSEAEIAELRRCCALWQAGPERFWGFDDVLKALSRSGSLGFYAAARQGGPWDGVILADVGPFSADLLYVFVMPHARQRGVGRQLVERLVEELRGRPELEALFLEVRASNLGAQKLYESLAMTRIDRRKGYYADGEDALVYKLDLKDV